MHRKITARAAMKGFMIALGTLALIGCAAQVPEAPTDQGAAVSSEDRGKVEAVLAGLDQTTLPAEQLADLYLDDAVILQPGAQPVEGREAIVALMQAQAAGPALDMTHRIDAISAHGDLIVVQGGVTGEARPADGSGPFPFATRNMILLKRDAAGEPKIWKVIFNNVPAD